MRRTKTGAATSAQGVAPITADFHRKPAFPRPGKDEILVCPLGGAGQIGMNFTLYGHDGRWILVDAGSAFPPRDVDGYEAIYPDVSNFAGILPQLDALVVTHAHEDHIGAIHRLWPKMGCPIYATPFAANVLSRRFEEAGTRSKITLKTFRPGAKLEIGTFRIKTVRMTHSVPECVALALSTPAGTVLHTGDWKFDPDPVIGKPCDIASLRSLGDDGVLAMICDSTNADRKGKSTSERDVAAGMRKAFRAVKGTVVVSCFSTNVARLAMIAQAAQDCERVAAIAGRSMINNEKAARETGLLAGIPKFLDHARLLRNFHKRNALLACTGTQGEANAALARMAAGERSGGLPALGHGDAVIHSARVIPGNEAEVHAIFDQLRGRGVQILTGDFDGSPLHVTGHATADELARMYRLVRPRFAIPVHGEEHHMNAHSAIAARAGVEHAEIPSEGDVFSVSERGLRKVASVPVRLVAMVSGHSRRTVDWNAEDPYAALVKPEPKRSRPRHRHRQREERPLMQAA